MSSMTLQASCKPCASPSAPFSDPFPQVSRSILHPRFLLALLAIALSLVLQAPALAIDDDVTPARKSSPSQSFKPDSSKPSSSKPSSSKPDSSNPAPSKELKDEADKLFKKDAPHLQSTPATSAWCIAIISIRAQDRDQAAPIALESIRTRGKLPDAFIDRRANATVIAVGQYDSPDDPQAKKDLDRIRAIEVDGELPYALAFLCPPQEEVKLGLHAEYNLLQAKVLYGQQAIQSLQIAVYGRDDLKDPKESDLKEVRQAAETAAVKLRQDGELAFYYHGPRRSMVTSGVFDTTDYDPQTPTYNSPRLRDAKLRHPYNLYNGAGIKEKFPHMKTPRMQPSFLVKIPDVPASLKPDAAKSDEKNKPAQSR